MLMLVFFPPGNVSMYGNQFEIFLCRHEIKSIQPLVLTWAFQGSGETETEDVARIFSVKVTNTLSGGATDCQNCMRGVKDNQ